MFHFKDSSSIASTGEPPTDDSNQPSLPNELQSSQTLTSTAGDSNSATSVQGSSTMNSSKLPTQEADSGYEASPSSVNDSCTFSFDGRQHTDSVSSTANEEESFMNIGVPDNQNSDPLADDEVEQFGDWLHVTMPSTDVTRMDVRDPSVNDSRLTESLPWPRDTRQTDHALTTAQGVVVRPGCLSVPIPVVRSFGDCLLRNHSRHRQTRCFTAIPSQSLPSPRDLPSSPPPLTSLLRLNTPYAMSWPGNRGYMNSFTPPPCDFNWSLLPSAFRDSEHYDRFARTSNHRRRPPGSEHSSYSSSRSESSEGSYDEEEDVFHDVYPANYVAPSSASAPTGNGNIWFMREGGPADRLPCYQQHSSPPNGNNVRRSRSASVNLPLDRHQIESIRAVGETLRRLSDQFETEMDLRQRMPRRRFTIGEVMNHSDEDPDFSGTPRHGKGGES